MGELFDRYVAVDWSAAGAPTTGSSSIWIAVAGPDDEPVLSNPPTRRRAALELAELIGRDRTLLAVDASLGFPRGAAEAVGLPGRSPWSAWWRQLTAMVTDDDANRNNRFEVAATLNRRVPGDGPFWGRPPHRPIEGLAPTKPVEFPVPEYRHVEALLRSTGRRPSSCWQLFGAGSVGGQTLTAVPVLERLRRRGGVEVWPFTTSWAAPRIAPGATVVAETWPTAFDLATRGDRVRDAAQVDGVVRAVRAADRVGSLAAWFVPPAGTSGAVCDEVTAEEGWVLFPS